MEAAMELVDTFEARHDDPMEPFLGRTWSDVESDRDAFAEAAEAKITKWAWGPCFAAWERYEPYWAEQDGERSKTRRLKGEPEDKRDAELFGFDDAGSVQVARRYGGPFGRDDLLEWEALRIGVDRCEAILNYTAESSVQHQRRLTALNVPAFDESGRLARLDWWRRFQGDDGFSWSATAYEYDGDQLKVMRKSRRDAPTYSGWEHHRIGDSLFDIRVGRASDLWLEYDRGGELLTIRSGGATGQVVYRRTAAGAVGKARRLLRDELPGRIAAWARRAAPDEPVYCLAIHYAEHYNAPLPPGLAFGTVRELDAWKAATLGEGLALTMWNPAEFGLYDLDPAELDAKELSGACQALNQEWRSTDDDRQPRQLLVAAAKTLAERDWSFLQVGPAGLAVYAIDLELVDLERNLRASVPKATRLGLATHR